MVFQNSMDKGSNMTSRKTLNYALIRYQPNRVRHEVLNIGIVLFDITGPLISIANDLKKLLAIDPNLSLSKIQEDAKALERLLRILWVKGKSAEEITKYFGSPAVGFTFSDIGIIDPQGNSNEMIFEELLFDLVLTPAKKKGYYTPRGSSLNSELRALFKRANRLSRDVNDIANHMVIPNYPIEADIGIYAEFALRNGKLRVTETVDFRGGEPATKKREAESKTLVLLQAREIVGRSDLFTSVVVSGVNQKTQSSINLLSRYTDDLIVRESDKDWSRYVAMMAKATNAPEMQVC